MRTALFAFSGWNVFCPVTLALLVLNAYVFKVGVSGSSPLDAPVFAFAWLWIIATPVTAIAALGVNVRVRSLAGWVVNGIVLALWIASFAALLFIGR